MDIVIAFDESTDQWVATVDDSSIADDCAHVAFLWAALQIMDDSESDETG
jgi:hypothetical protein